MKKILFFVLSVFFGFSVANAKKVEISVDFDYNDANTFNLFYEIYHETPFYKYLIVNSDMLSVFVRYFSDEEDLNKFYGDFASGQRDYTIYFSKTDNHYIIHLICQCMYIHYYTIEFDENMTFVKSNRVSTSYQFENVSFTPVKRNGQLECYEFFAFWQGSHKYYYSGNNSYTINRYYVDGQYYINLTKDDSFWRLLLKSFAGSFNGDKYDDDIDFGGYSSLRTYYTDHQIISQYTALAYLRDITLNFPNYDLSGYSYFYLNEVEQGIFLVPNFTSDEFSNVDFNIYLSSPDIGGNFFSTALSLKKEDDTCSSDCYYLPNDNYDFLNKEYNFSGTILKLDLRGFYEKITDNNYIDYVYHFFSTTYNNDIVIYYNPTYWTLSVPGTSQSIVSYKREHRFTANKEQAINSWNNLNHTVSDRLGSFGNINPDYAGTTSKPSGSGSSGSSGGSSGSSNVGDSSGITNTLNKYKPTDVLSNLSGIINTMTTFIAEFLGSFPSEISTPLYFFFIMTLAIAVIKLIF